MYKILLVEDNELSRDMLSRLLARRGYTVIVAMDGEQGVDEARRACPDLIVMDMSLPVVDGMEATRRLKNGVDTRDIPVIGFSAHAMESDRILAMESGCDDYDTKPVDIARLCQKIDALLAREPRTG